MGGNFTQNRSRPTALPYDYVNRFGGHTSGVDIPLASDQTTTSYRTGRGRRKTDAELVSEFTRTQENGYFKKSQFDNGHEFFSMSTRQTMNFPNEIVRGSSSWPLLRYEGPLRPQFNPSNLGTTYPSVNFMTTNELIHYGMLAISATAPNQPSSSVASTLGELFRDGIPHLSVLLSSISSGGGKLALPTGINRRKRIDGATAGSEYLNYEFGWKPLIRDTLGVLHSVIKSREILNQYARDGQPGLQVRRRWNNPVSSTSTRSKWADQWTVAVPDVRLFKSGLDLSDVYQWDTTTERYWASLCYSYFVNIDNTFLSKLDRYANEAQKLLGLGITPEVLWDLTPFSWLVDWKLDIGLAIGNATRFQDDDLVLRWGYLMREYTASRTWSMADIQFNNWIGPKPITFSLQKIAKERRRATPYGFALNPTDFNFGQWAILAAMGLTKAAKVLW